MKPKEADVWAGAFIELVESKTIYTRSTEELVQKVQADAIRAAAATIESRLTCGGQDDLRRVRIYRETLERLATEVETQSWDCGPVSH